ncbi:MAG TPA: hypothetical protein VGJ00_05730 [Rhabdochlamydiaceae bacterium]|jgi:hypothetical protein
MTAITTPLYFFVYKDIAEEDVSDETPDKIVEQCKSEDMQKKTQAAVARNEFGRTATELITNFRAKIPVERTYCCCRPATFTNGLAYLFLILAVAGFLTIWIGSDFGFLPDIPMYQLFIISGGSLTIGITLKIIAYFLNKPKNLDAIYNIYEEMIPQNYRDIFTKYGTCPVPDTYFAKDFKAYKTFYKTYEKAFKEYDKLPSSYRAYFQKQENPKRAAALLKYPTPSTAENQIV